MKRRASRKTNPRGVPTLRAERVRLDRGGYDPSGRYFGAGAPLYRVTNADGLIDEYVRAQDAPTARKLVAARPRVRNPKKKPRATANPAPRGVGMRPHEVDQAPAAYDRGYADAVMLRSQSLKDGMSNAWIKYPGGSTRATAYLWGFWHAIATGATAPQRRANPSERAKASTDYQATHGGLEGDVATMRARVPDPRASKLVVMGRLKRVEYITDKGRGESIYHHDFGRAFKGSEEHGRAKDERMPLIAFNRDGLVIAGGSYRVTPEGIVG